MHSQDSSRRTRGRSVWLCQQLLDFLDDGTGWEAAGFAADEGDDAVGAAEIAAVLDLENRAGVVGFAALDGCGEKFGVREDVAV